MDIPVVPKGTRKANRFSVTLSGGMSTIKEPTTSRIGENIVSGDFLQILPANGLSEPPTQNSSFSTTSIGPLADAASTTSTAWGSNINLGFAFAPRGQDEAGWRWTADLTYRKMSAASVAAYPNGGYQITGPSTVIPQYGTDEFTNTIFGYHRNTPAQTVEYYAGPVGLASAIGLDSFHQEEEFFSAQIGVGQNYKVVSPIGELRANLSGRIGAEYRFLKMGDNFQGILSGNSSDALYYRRTAEGPGFTAEINGSIDGPFPFSLPVRWQAFGGGGLEVANIEAQINVVSASLNSNAVLIPTQPGVDVMLSKPTGYGGVGVLVPIRQGLNLNLRMIRSNSNYLTSGVSSPSSKINSSVIFEDGTTIRFRSVFDDEIVGGLEYIF